MWSVQQVQLKLWKSKVIVGAAAGRYHSVFFTRHEVYTCGLNAGQLGKASLILFSSVHIQMYDNSYFVLYVTKSVALLSVL